ncbi:MAG: outer membrane lipoprotein-sorting protein [Desulforhopalus sp.]
MLNRQKQILFLVLIGVVILTVSPLAGDETPPEDDARAIVERAFDYWRGVGSVARFKMTIHRSDFERTMVLKGWTKGRQDALFFVEKPPKDAGNGTLKKGREMWSFNPKINRVIKLPPSMMSQSWMGSDFSNDDLAKSDTMIDDYIHTVKAKSSTDEGVVYTIESIAREDAPVVWSKQELDIREDNILLRQAFFDEEMVVVKEMTAEQIEMLGGRLFPRIWTMRRIDEEQRYTRMEYLELHFGADFDDRLFTLNSLKNRRR